MPTRQTVLLVGGTGRTGRRVLRQLLDRGVGVRAVVRSRARLPPDVAGHPALTVIEASWTWADWKGKLPVITNAGPAPAPAPR